MYNEVTILVAQPQHTRRKAASAFLVLRCGSPFSTQHHRMQTSLPPRDHRSPLVEALFPIGPQADLQA